MDQPPMMRFITEANSVCTAIEEEGHLEVFLQLRLNRLANDIKEFLKTDGLPKKEKENAMLLMHILRKINCKDCNLSSLKLFLNTHH